jgi:hypothetical protein
VNLSMNRIRRRYTGRFRRCSRRRQVQFSTRDLSSSYERDLMCQRPNDVSDVFRGLTSTFNPLPCIISYKRSVGRRIGGAAYCSWCRRRRVVGVGVAA